MRRCSVLITIVFRHTLRNVSVVIASCAVGGLCLLHVSLADCVRVLSSVHPLIWTTTGLVLPERAFMIC